MKLPAWLARYPLTPVAIVASLLGACITPRLGIDRFTADSPAFEALARSLLAGRGFTYHEPMFGSFVVHALRAPGYPVFLALGNLLGGTGTVLALQGAVNGLSAALLGALAVRLWGPGAGWIAFLVRFVWPDGWYHSGQIMSELLYECLAVLATLVTVAAVGRDSLRGLACAGLLSVVALFVRPAGITIIGPIGLWLLWKHWRYALVYGTVVLLAWAPWPIRNALRMHAFVPLTTMGGQVAWVGSTGLDPPIAWNYMATHLSLGEPGLDRYFWREAVRYARAHPGEVGERVARKALLNVVPIGRRPSLWLHRFAFLAALAALALRECRSRLVLPGGIWLAQGAFGIITNVMDRYRFTAEWVVVLAAALGVAAGAHRFGARRTAWATATLMLLCVAVSLVYR